MITPTCWGAPHPVMCDHLHESTSQYDAAAKVLTFLLVCPTCGIERVVETLEYEPRPVWTIPRTTQRQVAALPVEWHGKLAA